MTCFLQVFFMERQGYWGLTVRYKEATGLAGPVSSVHMSRGLTKWTEGPGRGGQTLLG